MSEGQVAALLLWLVLLAFSLNASLLRTLHANPLYQHLCLGSAIVLVPLWTLRAGLHEGLEIHFLGLTSLTLLLGWRLALLAPCLTLLILGTFGVTDLAEFGWQALIGIAHPDFREQLIADAEGAHHDIRIEIVSAATESDALEVARSIARNNLFKCAVFGNDPNWGRVLAAVGTTRAAFDPHLLDVTINGIEVCRAGGVGADRSLVDLTGREVHVVIDLHAGDASATVWTNDLTHDYVHENSAYST